MTGNKRLFKIVAYYDRVNISFGENSEGKVIDISTLFLNERVISLMFIWSKSQSRIYYV